MGLMQVSHGQVSPFISSNPSLTCKSRAHIDRMKKAEGVETEEKQCPEPEPEAAGAMMATSTNLLTITFTTFLAIFRLNHL